MIDLKDEAEALRAMSRPHASTRPRGRG